MINAIKYYYNLNISDIKQIGDDYIFDKYILKKYYKELNINLYNYLINKGIYLHRIIYNRDNKYITVINDIPFVLLKKEKEDLINLNLIKNYNIQLNNNNYPNWANLWSIKVDYYEKNIDNIKDEIIKKSFQYFIGMTENAILLFKTLNLSPTLYLCHQRFKDNYDFYDPLNIIVDYKMRDYAEYIKEEFYTNDKYYDSFIDKIINTFNYNDVILFFVRMLYPTPFFDAYDCYLKKDEIDYSFYNKKDAYEKYLKRIYKMIRKKYNIIDISWLK